MIGRSESWFRRVDARRAGPAAALGVALLACSLALLHLGFFEANQIVDTPVYERYGDAVLAGEIPYRDFALEYPPGALPVFLLPALAPAEGYRALFEALMWVCGAGAIAFLALALAALDAGPARLYGGAAFAGLAPLALGSVVLTRYDLWPAALAAAALAALLAGHERAAFGALGLAVGAKGYPLVLLPLALLYVGRRRGAREAGMGLAVFVATLAAVIVPLAILAPDGVAESFERQMSRPLQIESLGSAFLLAAHLIDGTYVPSIVSSYGSQNLDGSLADSVAVVQSALQLVAVAAAWVMFGSGRGDRESLAAAAAAAVAGFVAFGRVLSPQFLIWLIPLVPLVAGRLGLAASGLLAASLVTTQLWFPSRYWDVVALGGAGWLVLARDLVLAGLYVLLLAAIRRGRGGLRSA